MSRGNQQLLENAIQFHQMGRLVEAQTQYRKVLQHEPKNVDALNLLGVISSQLGDHKAAIELIGQAIAIRRDVPDYHLNYGEACRAAGRMTEAVAAYRKTIELGGADAQVYFCLGSALESANRMQEAVEAYRQSLRLHPVDTAYARLGFALQSLGRDEEAIVEYDRAIRAGATAEIYNNKGVAVQQMGKYQEAEALYDKALSLDANHVDSHLNRSIARLRKGDYAGGWPEYEWRWQRKEYDNLRRPYGRPRWDGGSLAGKTILVHSEQGVGDSIQFIRYATVLASRGARVVVETLEHLKMLAQRVKGVDQVIAMGEPLPSFDVEAPLGSLPMLCGTTLENIPAHVPYLTADPVIAEIWRNRLAGMGGGLKVGLVWAGNPKHTNDRNRSMSLATLAPLAQAGDLTFISLQKGPQELAGQRPPDGMRCLDFAGELSDFSQTAGLIANLDLVISVDTSVAHLAGAMGRPVWTLLPFVPDWRWLLEREDSPWYPTMRLFRQTTRKDWTSVLGRMAGELKKLVTGAGGGAGEMQALLKQPKEAVACVENAISPQANSAEAHFQLGRGLFEQGAVEQALACFQKALSINPRLSLAWIGVGLVHQREGRSQQAEEAARKGLELSPGDPDVLTNGANILTNSGLFAEARPFARKAVEVRPNSPVAWNCLGRIAEAHDENEEAIRCYGQAIGLLPNYIMARWNHAVALLRKGDYQRGWQAYEWRWKKWEGVFKPRQGLARPLWDGGELHGKTILLYQEQGLGDGIQFIRYVPLIVARGGRAIVESQAPVVRLFGMMPGVHASIERNARAPAFDVECPLMSLPRVLGTTLQTVPAKVPYLYPDATEAQAWKDRLAADGPGLRVGLVWAGSAANANDRQRSMMLADFAPLARIPGVRLISLQKGPASAQIAETQMGADMSDPTADLNDLATTAALIANLDLIITVDTAVAHLAGALGKPVWTLLPFVADWRWLLKREDSPWYPTMRLFRQTTQRDWTSVIGRVAGELKKLVACAGTGAGGTPEA